MWVRFCLSAGGALSAVGELGAPTPDPLPFWLRPVSIFTLKRRVGLSQITTFTSSSHMLTMPRHPSPQAPDAGARSVFSRFHCHPRVQGEGYLYRRLRTPLARRTLRWDTGGSTPGYVLQYRREASDIAAITVTCTTSCRTPTVCVIRMSLIGTSTPLRYGMIWHQRILEVIPPQER